MRPALRYQSQLLFRKSYKPKPILRIRPSLKTNRVFRPSRAGPQINLYESKTYRVQIRRDGRAPEGA